MATLYVFAGPNGSGKSTITESIKSEVDIGIYLNADEIEKSLIENRCFSFNSLINWEIEEASFKDFCRGHGLNKKVSDPDWLEKIHLQDNKLFLDVGLNINSYLSALLVDFLRVEFINQKVDFSFETVMSHSSKLDLLSSAKENGYKIVLYFVTTEDPIINVMRVQNRVEKGGHTVSEQKIIERYYRCMNLLNEAIKISDEAYLFDNSGDGEAAAYFAKVLNGENFIFSDECEEYPNWVDRYISNREE
ncbi:zeta toxin family protein [Flectobacillus sp. BAB-3569]|uniref:zeta toxin family protein n=1 Tax=Flectobacillus sp. BAB-3569 TaxID=1509483 RepID=UPI000BA3A5E3|nr:zeta toxin family protein [Flectobacillus sp. BAB-3569]PAC31048.1 zeta toxin [Flectobacillus sp. BAB-3569]